MAPVIQALRSTSWANVNILLSGQHGNMVDETLASFGLSGGGNLALMTPGQTLCGLTGRAFLAFEKGMTAFKPDIVLAQGDTTTVMVAAVSCFYLGIPFGHIEAGLRTGKFSSPFPEEFNRVAVSKIATLHFAPTPAAASALIRENVEPGSLFVTGNTVIDSLAAIVERAPTQAYRPAPGRRLILVTMHRRENFGPQLKGLLAALRRLVDTRGDLELLFPAHPNPVVRAAVAETLQCNERIRVCEPLPYIDFVGAMSASDVIVTDSGGVQEEAPFLKKPVLVTRTETERPEAVSFGAARLVGTDPESLTSALCEVLDRPEVYGKMASGASPYGDGYASQRIVQALEYHFGFSTAAPAPFAPI